MVLVDACDPQMKVTDVGNIIIGCQIVIDEVELYISTDIFWIVKRVSIRSRMIDMQRCNLHIRSPTYFTPFILKNVKYFLSLINKRLWKKTVSTRRKNVI
jgi:hypothetical protein